MRRSRVTLAALLVVVAVLAVGFAALRSSSGWWASGLFSLDVLLLCAAVVLAILRRDAARGFWVGFAVFGWAYLLLVFGGLLYPRLVTMTGHGADPPPLLHQALVQWGEEALSRGGRAATFSSGTSPEPIGGPAWNSPPPPPGIRRVPVIDTRNYRRTAHALALLVFALAGGLLGLWAGSGVAKLNPRASGRSDEGETRKV